MSTAPTLHDFLVYAPDFTDEEAFERRLKVRAQHLANAKVLTESGKIRFGGALTRPEDINKDAKDKKLTGSALVVRAASIEEVKELISSDIYTQTGVWDSEKVIIVPFAAPLVV